MSPGAIDESVHCTPESGDEAPTKESGGIINEALDMDSENKPGTKPPKKSSEKGGKLWKNNYEKSVINI